METISLQGVKELMAKENLPEIPKLVLRYLDTERKAREVDGEFFRISIEQQSKPTPRDGIAYSNELRIEKRRSQGWFQIYSTGMMQYRGAYAHEIDDWDLALSSPAILEESESEVLYGIQTGVGNVNIYRFSDESESDEPELVTTFNIRGHKAIQERINLCQSVVNDPEACLDYIRKSLGGRWQPALRVGLSDDKSWVFYASGEPLEDVDYSKPVEKAGIVVILATHFDRDYDPVADRYQLFVWERGKGFRSTDVHQTGLCHPPRKFHREDLDLLDVSVERRGQEFLLSVEVGNRKQKWKEKRVFHVL